MSTGRVPRTMRARLNERRARKDADAMAEAVAKYHNAKDDTAGFAPVGGYSTTQIARDSHWYPHDYRPTVGFTPNTAT